ncbi:Origin recognition complex subunit 6 [Sugiyamaella lignohabitans]|uniref:Origin recognition complex subunit 6 n=1 Tax=Sugiyamaella lignohabitans TaxID=796027 RepID=A0A167G096_9ASCO|nr:Origin recognition complex subunit 6 [Sugiyamaella lignohabitans]ANB15932.1 Origin recognition complex subunit 6 [Sugiyamaella lignohabitans]
MTSKVLENALEGLLPSVYPQFPKELISLSNSLLSQSKANVSSLKPDEEIARMTLCCHLAIERLTDSFNFPPPSTKKVPVPPKVYQNLLRLFRNALPRRGSASPVKLSAPSTPTKRPSPLKRAHLPDREGSPTPQRKKLNLNEGTRSDEGEDLNDVKSNTQGKATPSPVKRRGLAKETDPTPNDLHRIADGLQISDHAKNAVAFGYKKYNNLVKDRWGLLCGLFYVVCSRAHPELLVNQRRLENNIMSYAGDYSRMNDDKMAEWIIWADKIVADQSWIRDITVSIKRRPIGDSLRRKHSSGIGNMITFGFTFTSNRRIQMFEEWKSSIMKKIEEHKRPDSSETANDK